MYTGLRKIAHACFLAILCLSIPSGSVVLAQESAADSTPIGSVESKLERLGIIQAVISGKLEQRSALGEKIEQANEQDKADLRKQADALSADIEQLRNTLENIATGGLDSGLFTSNDAQKKSDWREDIALIAEPVIESLKDITEKPRKLAELNDTIAQRQEEIQTADKALSNLGPSLALKPSGDLGSALEQLNTLWTSRRSDALSAIEVANIQIAELQGNKPLAATLFDAVKQFVTGRGLTIVLAILAATVVWYGIRFLLRGYRASITDTAAPERRTRYRLAAYSVHALSFVLATLAVFAVFYERGDVLLLGLLILFIVGLALGIRHLLPRYISEARLLLNIGAMREKERLFYRGLPWRVESINMYTTLSNPELAGDLRIPLAELHGMTSRPTGDERWFPTSLGDVVLLSDDSVVEILNQNPDTVEQRRRGGQIVTTPTMQFYEQEMTNLTRGGTFGVNTTFGIDYQHQSISLNEIPEYLEATIRRFLEASSFDGYIINVQVELKEANSSSLDYWIFVTCDSKIALAYLDIQRLIQRACIEASTVNALTIPFPHISLVKKQPVA